MMRRLLGSVGVATVVAASLTPASRAQSPIKTVPGVTPGTGAKGTLQPRTPDGQPDLTGFWTNSSYVPLERPKNVTKEFYTPEEVAQMEKEAAAREDEQTVPGTASDVHYDGTQFGLGRSQGTYARSLRTSLITDPPDGRIPQLSPAGQQRLAERNEARKQRNINLFSVEHPNGRYDAAENNSLDDRCIVTGHSGPPMASAGYNGTYQIIQSPGYVMILVENNHVRSHDSHRRETRPPAERSLVDRGVARSLGGHHSRGGDDELQHEPRVPRAAASRRFGMRSART